MALFSTGRLSTTASVNSALAIARRHSNFHQRISPVLPPGTQPFAAAAARRPRKRDLDLGPFTDLRLDADAPSGRLHDPARTKARSSSMMATVTLLEVRRSLYPST